MITTLLATQYVVRIRIHAVNFHIGVQGKSHYSVVPDAEATVFDDPADADEMARQHGLKHGQFTVQPKETNDTVKI